jgi:alcohol dehydrogenase (NADP+)
MPSQQQNAATERVKSFANHLQAQPNSNSTASTKVLKESKAAEMSDYKFEGWVGLDKASADGKMVWQEFEPKTWTEDDVDIKVTHCGICGSDLHTLRSGWVSLLVPIFNLP